MIEVGSRPDEALSEIVKLQNAISLKNWAFRVADLPQEFPGTMIERDSGVMTRRHLQRTVDIPFPE